jgi:preprotein translocase subunit SecB
MVEAPRLLFPFARAVASNTIRESGFIPVMLTPIDFLAMYNSSKGQLGTATAAGVA